MGELKHMACEPRDKLLVGEELGPGDQLVSKNLEFKLVLQGDGNLVAYGPEGDYWNSGTNSGTRLVLQSDGNLVLYDAGGRDLKATGTSGSTAFVVQNDGNLVVYQHG